MNGDQELLLQWRWPEGAQGLLGWFDGVEEAISRVLDATANGHRWGAMSGNGKVQVACSVADQCRAVQDLLAALDPLGPPVASPIIAVRDGSGYRVVFPPDHHEPFVSMWGVTRGSWAGTPAE